MLFRSSRCANLLGTWTSGPHSPKAPLGQLERPEPRPRRRPRKPLPTPSWPHSFRPVNKGTVGKRSVVMHLRLYGYIPTHDTSIFVIYHSRIRSMEDWVCFELKTGGCSFVVLCTFYRYSLYVKLIHTYYATSVFCPASVVGGILKFVDAARNTWMIRT